MMNSIELQGPRANYTIEASEVDALKGTTASGFFESVWDSIADWFCGTHKAEAKQAFRDLLNPDSTPEKKLESFMRLEQMVAEPYKDKFHYQVMDNNRLEIAMDIDGLPPQELKLQTGLQSGALGKIIDGYGKDSQEERFMVLSKDISRIDYNIEGIHHFRTEDNISEGEKQKTIRDFVNTLSTDYQKTMLATLATQSSTLSLRSLACESDGKFQPMGNNHQQAIEIRRCGADNIRVDVHYSNDVPEGPLQDYAKESGYYTNTKIQASFIIGKEQTICLNAEFSGDGKSLKLPVNPG